MASTYSTNLNLEKQSGDQYYDVNVVNQNLDKVDTAFGRNNICLNVSGLFSLPRTISDPKITANHRVVSTVLSNTLAQPSDWTYTVSAGKIVISGTISGTTDATLFLSEVYGAPSITQTIKANASKSDISKLNTERAKQIWLTDSDNTWEKIWTKLDTLDVGYTATFRGNASCMMILSGNARNFALNGTVTRTASSTFGFIGRIGGNNILLCEITNASVTTRGSYTESDLSYILNNKVLNMVGSKGVELQSGDDLNNFRDGGLYYSPNMATTNSLLHCPHKDSNFTLIVKDTTSGSWGMQIILATGSIATIYYRSINNQSWTPWGFITSGQWMFTGDIDALDIAPGTYTLGSPSTYTHASLTALGYEPAYALFVQYPAYRTQMIIDGAKIWTRRYTGNPAAWGTWSPKTNDCLYYFDTENSTRYTLELVGGDLRVAKKVGAGTSQWKSIANAEQSTAFTSNGIVSVRSELSGGATLYLNHSAPVLLYADRGGMWTEGTTGRTLSTVQANSYITVTRVSNSKLKIVSGYSSGLGTNLNVLTTDKNVSFTTS